MEKKINIDLSEKEIAEILSGMDTFQLSKVLTEWNKIVKENHKQSIKEGKMNFWHNLGDVFMWISDHSDENLDLHDCIRAMYASSIAKIGIANFNQIYKENA